MQLEQKIVVASYTGDEKRRLIAFYTNINQNFLHHIQFITSVITHTSILTRFRELRLVF